MDIIHTTTYLGKVWVKIADAHDGDDMVVLVVVWFEQKWRRVHVTRL